MYIPKAFEEKEQSKIKEFIENNSFGILFSQNEQGPFATHLPFLLEEQCLISHFAKANPHWKMLDDQEVLIVFHGPHAYISPAWYEEENTVPTWNYTAVHIKGRVKIVQDSARAKEILNKTIQYYEQYEGTNWSVDLDASFVNSLVKGIVAFEVSVDSVEGKWKLNQNHPLKRQQNTVEGLQQSSQVFAAQIAELMKANLKA